MARAKQVNGMLVSSHESTGRVSVRTGGPLLGFDKPAPPGVILTVARLVPDARDALPHGEYEDRIADYQRRIEAGLPLPQFGCESPAVPGPGAVKRRGHLIECWACEKVETLKRFWSHGWASRPFREGGSSSAVELYCPKCFSIWGWPDEFDAIICAVEGVAAILESCASEGERVDRDGGGAGHEPDDAGSRRSAGGCGEAVSL